MVRELLTPRLYVMVGVPGSGKTTYARKTYPDALRVCLDDLRLMLCGRTFDLSYEPVVAVAADAVKEAVAAYAAAHGKDVLFDATNVSVERRADLIDTARRHGFSPVAIYVASPLRLAHRRNARRPDPVPYAVVNTFAARLVPPTTDEGFDEVLVIEPRDNPVNGRGTPSP